MMSKSTLVQTICLIAVLLASARAYNIAESEYDACDSGNVTCYGIHGQNCVKERFCEYMVGIAEDADSVSFTSANLDDNNITKIVGISPFRKATGNSGANYTYECKPKITAKDFRVIVYQFSSLGQTGSVGSSRSLIAWDEIIEGQSVSAENKKAIQKSTWEESCRDRLVEVNRLSRLVKEGRFTPKDASYFNVPFVINNEFVFVLETLSASRLFDDAQEIKARDGSIYTSTDEVLYSNFPNIETVLKPYQAPNAKANASKNIGLSATLTLILSLLIIVRI